MLYFTDSESDHFPFQTHRMGDKIKTQINSVGIPHISMSAKYGSCRKAQFVVTSGTGVLGNNVHAICKLPAADKNDECLMIGVGKVFQK